LSATTCELLSSTWPEPSWIDPVRAVHAVRVGMVPFFSLETTRTATMAQGIELRETITSATTLERHPALSELVCFDPYAASRAVTNLYRPAADRHWSSPVLTGDGPRT